MCVFALQESENWAELLPGLVRETLARAVVAYAEGQVDAVAPTSPKTVLQHHLDSHRAASPLSLPRRVLFIVAWVTSVYATGRGLDALATVWM